MKNRTSAKIVSRSEAKRSYDPACFPPQFDVEDRHFWFRARNRVIATLVSQAMADRSSNCRILEVGCGTGNVLRVLEKASPQARVVGMDLYAEGLQFARRRTCCPLVQGDIGAAPFRTQFDLIGLFDVLEHLPDDTQVLRDLHGLLAQGGTLLLTVPAHPSLWSYFDEACHHCRRYDLPELERKLIDTGYRVEYLTQFMVSIFPLLWLTRRLGGLLHRRAPDDGEHLRKLATREFRIIPVVNGLLGWSLGLEVRQIARRRSLPLGTSLLVVARKEA